ncbi:MAG TPA: hypothetical protein VGC67_18065 [Cellulomonas sp.]
MTPAPGVPGPEGADARPADEREVVTAADLVLRTPDGDLPYRAEAGHLLVRDGAGEPLATVFFVAYTATGPDRPGSDRPLTYLFNGGPGSASLWLNVGGFGPRRPAQRTPHATPPAPYAIEPNTQSLLPVSDLVFLDAPGTGHSRILDGVDPARVWGVDADGDVFARAILRHLARTGRWNSPRYLFGESYGTTRAAVVAHRLQNLGLDLNGIVLLSTLLDWTANQPGADQGFVNLLPTYAATARYHGRAARTELDDAAFDAAAIDFAQGRYAAALQRGDGLDAAEEAAVAAELSALVGLDAGYLASRHLRVGLEEFRARLLADEGRLIGRFDTRFVAEHAYVVGGGAMDPATDDAATAGVTSALVTAFADHLGREIGYASPTAYVPLNNMVVEPAWDWRHRAPAIDEPMPLPNVALDLSAAMRRNPHLRVLVLGGRYDLATPYLGARYDLAHLFLGERLRANVTLRSYDSGHMAFVDDAALAAMTADVGAFLRGA